MLLQRLEKRLKRNMVSLDSDIIISNLDIVVSFYSIRRY